MPGTVGVIGSINVDLTLLVDRIPGPGETLLGSGGTLSPGGKGANQAVAAARQGAAVLLVGAVGRDANAAAATELLRQSRVDLALVAEADDPTGLAVVTVDRQAENSIVVVPGANLAVDIARVTAALPRLAGCDVVVLQGEVPPQTVEYALDALAAAGVRTVLNLAPVVPLAAEAIRRAAVLVVNEHEAEQALRILTGGRLDLTGEPVPDGTALARALAAAGLAAVVVTLGARGAVLADGGGTVHVPAPAVAAVDTTGAGDAFVGAMAAGLASGLALQQACELAAEVAARTVTAPGAQQSYPWAGEPGRPSAGG
ncbi:ribokinase [Arthrobacter sp. I2-34]|uniref:Ribokinase n=1 Tax=Arthrobacter hankyongi TaxID=2904801 RepID=A0ABS9L288_9MICC|nr:ribokinase [Arthrobacter hankyongi]MCG2620790.1 ribokinase [Arthrobacter hankyongi]